MNYMSIIKNFNSKGWVRLYRQIEDNELYFLEPFTKVQAWIDLFLNANHKDNLLSIRGNIVQIKRGQIGWSELTMAKRWQWSKDKVRRYLRLLKTIQQIKQQKTFIITVITILNYDKFQQDNTADKTAERQQKDSRRYTNKNDKNDKSILRKRKNNLMRYDYSHSWNEEKKIDPLKGEIDNILGAFDTQYKKDIGERMYQYNIPLARKSVKDALKSYKEKELIELMPAFFSNEFYRNTGWAIWTMMSSKVLNQLKNGR